MSLLAPFHPHVRLSVRPSFFFPFESAYARNDAPGRKNGRLGIGMVAKEGTCFALAGAPDLRVRNVYTRMQFHLIESNRSWNTVILYESQNCSWQNI